MCTWDWHSAHPVRGTRAETVQQRRSVDAGYGTYAHPVCGGLARGPQGPCEPAHYASKREGANAAK